MRESQGMANIILGKQNESRVDVTLGQLGDALAEALRSPSRGQGEAIEEQAASSPSRTAARAPTPPRLPWPPWCLRRTWDSACPRDAPCWRRRSRGNCPP